MMTFKKKSLTNQTPPPLILNLRNKSYYFNYFNYIFTKACRVHQTLSKALNLVLKMKCGGAPPGAWNFIKTLKYSHFRQKIGLL